MWMILLFIYFIQTINYHNIRIQKHTIQEEVL